MTAVRTQYDFFEFPGVNGIGTGRDPTSGDFIIKIGVLDSSQIGALPTNIDGVSIVTEVGGMACYDFCATALPEPSGLLLLGLGLAVVPAVKRRRSRQG